MMETTEVRCEIRELTTARLDDQELRPAGIIVAMAEDRGSGYDFYDAQTTFVILPDSRELIGKRATSAQVHLYVTTANSVLPKDYDFSQIVSWNPGSALLFWDGILDKYYETVRNEKYTTLEETLILGIRFPLLSFEKDEAVSEWVSSDLFFPSEVDIGKLLVNGGRCSLSCFPPEVYFGNYEYRSTRVFAEEPYFTVSLSDTLFYRPANMFPRDYLGPKVDKEFTWNYVPDPGNIGDNADSPMFSQAGSTFFIRKKGETEITSIDIPGAVNKYVMPAGTLEDFAEYEWTARVQVDGSEEEAIGATGDWITLSTTDALPTCTILTPKNTYLEKTSETDLDWQYDVSTGLAQYAFDAQYKTESGEWTTFAEHIVQPETAYTIPGDTLPSGTVFLRVRGYNANDLPGEWSDPTQVTVIGKPATPEVRVDAISPRPKISWASESQTGFQVRVGTYESKQIAGTQRAYKVPEYLPDGHTVAGVRIANEFGFWSDWGEVSFTIKNDVLPMGTLLADGSRDNVVRLTMDSPGALHYIFKDGELIGKTAERTFVDVMATGSAAYQVLKTNGDRYVYSPVVNACVPIRGGLLAGADGEWFDVGTRYGAPPELAQSDVANIAYMQYAGRRFPVADVGPGRTRTFAFECVFPPGDPRIQKMDDLTGRLVLYKDENGIAAHGVLETVEWIKTRRYSVAACTIVQTSGPEEIEYDL